MAALMNLERPDPDQESSEAAVFHRKIEFHLARKSVSGFGNNNSNSNNKGFKLVTLNPSGPPESVKETGSGKKSERPELSGTGLDQEISFTITFRRIGAGLRNLGNTCFLNSVLQCLTYTEPLAAYLQSGKHQNSCRMAGFCALCAIQKHVSRALQSTGRILEPKDLVSNLRCISRSFRNARQEDAHEYMVNLLECMHKCCLPSGVPSESPSAYEKSLVHKIFGGRLRSQVKCMQCSFCSDKFDPFLDLSLEIVKADSLYKALGHFTAKEQLDGGAKQYQCQQCKQKVRALKQLTVYDAPHVLTIHLKRFGSHLQGQKINKNVAFGPTLDLKPFVTGPYDGDLKYTLYGVLVHAGWSTHSGHYYCFVRTSSGMWYSLDDNQVFQVSEKKVLEQKAYMLFYVRDRSNIFPKKPVDVGHKENIVTNAIGNAVYSKFNLELKETSQNGFMERRLNGNFSALSGKDARATTAPEKTPLESSLSQNVNGIRGTDCLVLKKDPRLEPSSSLPPKRNLGDSSNATKNSVGHQAESGLTVEAPGKTLDADLNANVLADCRKKETSEVCISASKISRGSADQPSDGSSFRTSSREASNMDNTTSKVCNGNAIPVGTIEEASKSSLEESQVGVDSRVEVNLQLLSEPPATTKRFSSAIAKSKRPQIKLKRKLFKCQVSSMVLSSNIIFGAAFCMRKKQKRRKNHDKQKKSSSLKHLLDGNDLTSHLGPSTSCNSLPVLTDHCPQSQRKKAKYSPVDKDKNLSLQNNSGNEVTSSDFVVNELKQRVEPGTTMLSSKNPHATESIAQRPGTSDDYSMETRENSMMDILTRGLEETTVARWDGIDVSLPPKAESGVEKGQIGYIGDEWDEEYDRGRRKKIRCSTIEFGGPNLFQEIATRKNAKRKGSKLSRSDSGNQPFRI